MRKLTVRRTSFLEYAEALKSIPEPFTTNGALSGIAGTPDRGFYGFGQLDESSDFGKLFRNSWEAQDITYTVLSWHTPIAFRLSSGEWHVDMTYYSVSTSKHQNKIFCALVDFSHPVIHGR